MSRQRRKAEQQIEYKMGLWSLRIGVALFFLGVLLAAGYWYSLEGDYEKFIISAAFPISLALGFISVAFIVPGAVFVIQGDGHKKKPKPNYEQVRIPGTPQPVSPPKPQKIKPKTPSKLPKVLLALCLLCVVSFVIALIIVAMVMF